MCAEMVGLEPEHMNGRGSGESLAGCWRNIAIALIHRVPREIVDSGNPPALTKRNHFINGGMRHLAWMVKCRLVM
jgi:hypothetical protein